MCATLLQLSGVVENAKATISFAGTVSHNLNSALNFSFETLTFPVTRACAFISLQSSNLGLTWAISGFWTNESFFRGLKRPDLLKLVSITFEISAPISSISLPSFLNSNLFLLDVSELLI